MRKFTFLKIFLVFFLCLTPISCHHLNNIETNPTEINDGNQIIFGAMYTAFEQDFTKVQFDSICNADRISNNLKKWHMLSSIDGESGQIFNEYMYIKYQNNVEYIYRLMMIDDNTYNISKRIKK